MRRFAELEGCLDHNPSLPIVLQEGGSTYRPNQRQHRSKRSPESVPEVVGAVARDRHLVKRLAKAGAVRLEVWPAGVESPRDRFKLVRRLGAEVRGCLFALKGRQGHGQRRGCPEDVREFGVDARGELVRGKERTEQSDVGRRTCAS